MFNNRRVEEDLARIRNANPGADLLSKKPDDVLQEKPAKHLHEDLKERVSAKDVFAMAIAVLSLLLPYVLILFGLIALVLFLFFR